MNNDLNIAVARALGYTVYHYDKAHAEDCYYMLMDGNFDPVVQGIRWSDGARRTEEEAWADVPAFSTDPTAAMTLVDAIDRLGCQVFMLTYDRVRSYWYAAFGESDDQLLYRDPDERWCHAETPAEAIAAAFLKVASGAALRAGEEGTNVQD